MTHDPSCGKDQVVVTDNGGFLKPCTCYVDSMTPEERAEQANIQAGVVVTTTSAPQEKVSWEEPVRRAIFANHLSVEIAEQSYKQVRKLIRTAIETAIKEQERRNIAITDNAIENALIAEQERIAGEVEKLRRTDETQMSHDHVYDEALDDVLSIITPQ